MKIKNTFIVGLLTSILLLGCSESNLLDQVNPNQASTSTFWRNSEDAIKGLNAAYSGMQDY